MDKYEVEVVIVGSGPAGAACGRALSEEGVSALIVEKEALPRHKVCTGMVLGQAQELIERYFGEAPAEYVLANPGTFKPSNVVEWNKEKGFSPFRLELPKDGQDFSRDYLNVWRNKFDHWLLKKSGAEVRDNCQLRELSESNDKYQLRLTDKSGNDTRLSCSYLVAADGAGSRIREMVEPSSAGQTPLTVCGYQAFYQVEDMGSLGEANCYVFREREFGDILAIVQRKDAHLELAVAGLKGCNLRQCTENLKSFLAKEFQVALGGLEKGRGCTGKIKPPYLGKGQVLMAGDAAGLTYLNGEGICTAIDSGYKAGKAIVRGIKDGRNALAEYENDTRSIISHMQVCAAQQQFLVP